MLRTRGPHAHARTYRSAPAPLPLYSRTSWVSEDLDEVCRMRAVSQETIDLLLTRRSAKPAMLGAPGPSSAELATILTAATRVPDHKKLVPWRFMVFEGEAGAA